MKQVNEILPKTLQSVSTDRPEKTSSPRKKLSMRLVNQLFARFQGNYGHRFSSQYATNRLLDIAKDVWAHELSPFDVNDFSYAMREMKKHHKDFPPSLPRFAELCRMRNKTMLTPDIPKVESSSKAVGNAAIAEMRKSLGI